MTLKRRAELKWECFLEWINNKIRRSSPLPKLRPNGRVNLTPSPSQECVALQRADSSFFRLPYDIRRMILVEAFGNSPLHMDLFFIYPIVPLEERKRDPDLAKRHAYLDWTSTTFAHKPNDWTARRWRWQSTVCHRGNGHRFGYIHSGPWDDNCRWGVALCNYRPERSEYSGLSDCFIGVMGWLLSCRQALVPHLPFSPDPKYWSSL